MHFLFLLSFIDLLNNAFTNSKNKALKSNSFQLIK